MRTYNDYVALKVQTYGLLFDDSELAKKFIPYFESGQRIIIEHKLGGIERGYVGVTTGYRPSFLLIHRKSDYGSSTLLDNNDKIIGTVNKYMK